MLCIVKYIVDVMLLHFVASDSGALVRNRVVGLRASEIQHVFRNFDFSAECSKLKVSYFVYLENFYKKYYLLTSCFANNFTLVLISTMQETATTFETVTECWSTQCIHEIK